MKILIEEIVRSHQTKSPITYRRRRDSLYELPEVIADQFECGDHLRHVRDSRDLRVLRARVALLEDAVGLIVDVCEEAVFLEIEANVQAIHGGGCHLTAGAGENYDDWLARHEVPS